MMQSLRGIAASISVSSAAEEEQWQKTGKKPKNTFAPDRAVRDDQEKSEWYGRDFQNLAEMGMGTKLDGLVSWMQGAM